MASGKMVFKVRVVSSVKIVLGCIIMDLSKITLIADEINKLEIKWAVGASVMLYFHGLDILVHESDAKQLDKLLKNMGVRKDK